MKNSGRHCLALFSAVGLLIAMAGWANADPGGIRKEINEVKAQVTALQGQVSSLQTNDAALTAAVAQLQANTVSLTTMVAALQTSNAALISQISALQATLGSSGASGEVLWTYFEDTEPFTVCGSPSADTDGCDIGGGGDNIIRLVNPNGSTSSFFGAVHNVCAMIYVFDDDQEMGECCGCPLSPTQVASFSVAQNLTSDWAIAGGAEGADHGTGSLAIIAAAPNATSPGPVGGTNCLGSDCCNPTNVPGYTVSKANTLLGTITHNQLVSNNNSPPSATSGLTEVGLSDAGSGDPVNLRYLTLQCGSIIANSSASGICNCPVE